MPIILLILVFIAAEIWRHGHTAASTHAADAPQSKSRVQAGASAGERRIRSVGGQALPMQALVVPVLLQAAHETNDCRQVGRVAGQHRYCLQHR
jgi:hypothetical protein